MIDTNNLSINDYNSHDPNRQLQKAPSSNKSSSSSFFNRKAASIPKNRQHHDSENEKLGRERLRQFYERKHTDNQLQTLK